MNSSKVFKLFLSISMAMIVTFSGVVLTYAATESSPEVSAETAVEKTAPVTIKIEDVTNPDTYLKYWDIAKDWLLINGPGILIAFAIFIFGRWVAMWASSMTKRALNKAGVDQTLRSFLGKLVYYCLLVGVIIAAAGQLGIQTTSFIAIVGAAGLAIGLALKDSLSNFASGVMLILFSPFKVGDVVTAGGVTGKVQQIDLFSTIILTPDNQRVIVPNSGITSGVITNINAEETRRIDLIVGIGYDDDIRLAKETLVELVTADPEVLRDPEPVVAVAELADSSVNFIVRPWVKTEKYWDVRLRLTENIKHTFDEKGISFPYPQQDVHMYQSGAE